MANNCSYIDGIGSSQVIDSSGEIVDLAGLDCSSLVGGPFSWEHKADLPAQIIGKILDYKKIFSEKDCDNERHKHFWKKVKAPFLYVTGRLYDDRQPSAKEAAAIMQDDADHPGEKPMIGFSVEGSKLPGAKEGMTITHSIARKITLTAIPCNKTCFAEIMPKKSDKKKDDDFDSLFKGEVEFFKPDSALLEFLEKKEKDLKKDVGTGGGAFIGGGMLAMSESENGGKAGYTISHELHERHPDYGCKMMEITAHHPKHGEVGSHLVQLSPNDDEPRASDKNPITMHISVDPRHRRKGLATAMHSYGEKHLKTSISHGQPSTPEGKDFVESFSKSESLEKAEKGQTYKQVFGGYTNKKKGHSGLLGVVADNHETGKTTHVFNAHAECMMDQPGTRFPSHSTYTAYPIESLKEEHQKPHQPCAAGEECPHYKEFGKSESLEKGEKGDWQKEGYTLKTSFDHKDPEKNEAADVAVKAFDRTGKEVGRYLFNHHPEKRALTVEGANTHREHRRKGLASAAYSLAEAHTQKPILNRPYNQSQDAIALWSQKDRPFGKSESLEKADPASAPKAPSKPPAPAQAAGPAQPIPPGAPPAAKASQLPHGWAPFRGKHPVVGDVVGFGHGKHGDVSIFKDKGTGKYSVHHGNRPAGVMGHKGTGFNKPSEALAHAAKYIDALHHGRVVPPSTTGSDPMQKSESQHKDSGWYKVAEGHHPFPEMEQHEREILPHGSRDKPHYALHVQKLDNGKYEAFVGHHPNFSGLPTQVHESHHDTKEQAMKAAEHAHAKHAAEHGLHKSLTAGSGMVAPSQLTQGAALAKEDLLKAKVDVGLTDKQKAKQRAERNLRTTESDLSEWYKYPSQQRARKVAIERGSPGKFGQKITGEPRPSSVKGVVTPGRNLRDIESKKEEHKKILSELKAIKPKLAKSEADSEPGSYGNVKPHVGHSEMKNQPPGFHAKQAKLHRQHSETAKNNGHTDLAEKHAKMAKMHEHYDTAELFAPNTGGKGTSYSDLREGRKVHTDIARKLHQELSKSETLIRAEEAYSTWSKREEFEKFMSNRMPHLTKREVQAIGHAIAFGKSSEAESKLAKMVGSFWPKSEGEVPVSQNECNEHLEKAEYADTVYRNHDDSVRVNIHRHPSGGWDYRVHYKNPESHKNHPGAPKHSQTYTSSFGESPFPKKSHAKQNVEKHFGKLSSMPNLPSMDHGWE